MSRLRVLRKSPGVAAAFFIHITKKSEKGVDAHVLPCQLVFITGAALSATKSASFLQATLVL